MKTVKRYANAVDVLPPPLARKLLGLVRGRVWIPVRRRRRFKTAGDPARNRRIRELARGGWTLQEIAEEVRLCKERVRQILGGRPTRRSPRSTAFSEKTSGSAARSSRSSRPGTRA